MNRSKEPPVSLCERSFVLDAIKENKRLDGRGVYDYRALEILPSAQPGSVEVQLGRTRVLANVSCEVVRPRPQRPTEGELFLNVELSPMASPGFEVSRPSAQGTEVSRTLERCLKESRAIDTESLCIIAGEKVWSVRVDLHVLDHCGNIVDCAAIAAITALKHFRRPDVTVIGENATIHPVTEREPVPLSVHHMPLCTSFAFFWDGAYLLVDPSLEEEEVMDGRLVVGMNIHREICVLQMAGGVAILPDQLLRCSKIATVKCAEITEMIKNALTGATQRKKTNTILQSKRGQVEISVPEVTREAGGEEMEEERGAGEEEVVSYLGEGTAEVGIGGSSKWTVDQGGEETGSCGDVEGGEGEDGMAELEEKRSADDNIGEDGRVRSGGGGEGVKGEGGGGRSSSEEEDVVVLTEKDIGGFEKTGTGEMEQKRGRGRGRGRRRRRRRKEQQPFYPEPQSFQPWPSQSLRDS